MFIGAGLYLFCHCYIKRPLSTTCVLSFYDPSAALLEETAAVYPPADLELL